jgi:sortase A
MRNSKFIVILFIAGLLVLAYPHSAQFVNKRIQKTTVEQFQQEVRQLPASDVSESVETAKQCNESIFTSEEGLHDPFTEGYSLGAYKGCKDVPPNGTLFASLEIPALNLTIPIYLGANEESLTRGVGQVEGSSLPVGGNNTHTVLAAHRGMGTKEMFRNLDDLKIGDMFFILTMKQILKYQVYEIEVILPNETASLEIIEGSDLASLITCHPYRSNSHRLVVHGKRVE